MAKARRYVAGFYDYREQCVCLKPEGENEFLMFPFAYYFYLKGRPKEDVLGLFQEAEMDRSYCRCYLKPSNAERKAVIGVLEKHGVETYEGDVSPINRFLNDNDIEYGKLRVLYFDLETDGSAGWEALEKHRILLIGYHSTVTGKTASIFAGEGPEGERQAISEFLDLVKTHDLLVAWNGDAYDEPVLRARSEKLGFGDRWAEHWQGVNFLDMMRLFKKYYARDDKGEGVRVSFALDNIAQTVLGHGKVKKPMTCRDGKINPVRAIIEAWEQAPFDLIEYCERDVDIMVELDKKLGFLLFHQTVSNLCGRFLSSYTLWTGYLNDAFILRYGNKNDKRFRTKFTFYDETIEVEKVEGAYVMAPVPGMHENVCDLDFASLYPNVIRTFNISPDVKVTTKNEREGPLAFNGARFRKDERGVFPEIVEQTLNLRKKFKQKVIALEEADKEGTLEHLRAKQMSDAYKLLGNSMYGLLGAPKLRFYDPECAEAVTISGKSIIQYVIAQAGARKMPVLYSDTDSCFVQCTKTRALEFAKEMEPELDKFVSDRGGTPGFIRLDLDVVYERIVFVTKKRYAGVKDTGKIDVKGLEFIRTDGCKIARDMQKRIIEYLLLVNEPNVERVFKIVSKYRAKIYDRQVQLEDIVLAQSLGKKLDSYKAIPPHVRVAQEMLDEGQEIYEGMKIPYVIIGNDKKQIVTHASKYTGQYDEDFYWRKKIYPPTEAILEVVFKDAGEKELLSYLCPKKPRKVRARK